MTLLHTSNWPVFMNRVASLTKPCRYSNPPASAIPKIPISGTCARRCSFMRGVLRKPILPSAMDCRGSLGMFIGGGGASSSRWVGRSGEGRGGGEGRFRWAADYLKKKKEKVGVLGILYDIDHLEMSCKIAMLSMVS